MATTPDSSNSSAFPVSTDPNYYLTQAGLGALTQPWTQQSLMQAFGPGGMASTPYNMMATNPFLQLVMQSGESALRTQRPTAVNGFNEDQGGGISGLMG